jgi:hypothetical protein
MGQEWDKGTGTASQAVPSWPAYIRKSEKAVSHKHYIKKPANFNPLAFLIKNCFFNQTFD